MRALPNLLTVLRLGLAAVFPFAPPGWGLAIVLAAGCSDVLDGWIARRFGATSVVGALLDGIADKAFVITVLGTLLGRGEIAWWQAGLVLVRDATVAVTFLYVLWRRAWEALPHMDARLPGKLTTTVLFAWFVALLAKPLEALIGPLFVLGAAASVWAGVDYAVRFVTLLGVATRRAAER